MQQSAQWHSIDHCKSAILLFLARLMFLAELWCPAAANKGRACMQFSNACSQLCLHPSVVLHLVGAYVLARIRSNGCTVLCID